MRPWPSNRASVERWTEASAEDRACKGEGSSVARYRGNLKKPSVVTKRCGLQFVLDDGVE